MASLITVRLTKADAPNLGFRLQGGQDFGTPLVIQKVNGGSPAERAGLIAGDSVIKINTTDVFNLRHKDAQDVIVRAGPSFEITVQRGGSTWKPSVIPTGSFAAPSPASSIHNVSPVTKTSLAAPKKENIGAIGTGHNLSAKPFSPQVNGAVNGSPRLVNNQYNSPLKLYSEESIAETLSAQTEVLSTGALGVNFKKNEKNYDSTNSAVYRMLQEAEQEPKSQEAEPDSGVVSAPVGVAGLRHVAAPETRPAPPQPQLPPGQNICADCERLIVGVFVRIKDKNLHVECFKCSTCGASLKNVGYYNINNKLYCDVHAKLAARNNPPAPNLVPVTVPPGGKAPVNAISAALASHSLPSPAPLSPRTNLAQPFQPQPPTLLPIQQEHNNQDELPIEPAAPAPATTIANLSSPMQSLNITSEFNNNNKNNYNNALLNSTPLSFERYISKAGNFSSPKPFSSVSAPGGFPRAAPLSPVAPPSAPISAPAPSTFSPASSTDRSVNIVWPPPPEEPEVPTACPLYFPPSTHLKVQPPKPKIPIIPPDYDDQEYFEDYYNPYDQEIEDLEFMAQFQEPKMSLTSEEVSAITKSATECIETIKETLETQKLVENILKDRPQSPPPLPDNPEQKLKYGEVPERVLKPAPDQTGLSERRELKRLTDYSPNTVECHLKSQVENAVPKKWESQMVQALKTLPGSDPAGSEDPFTQIPARHSGTPLASALAIAPTVPFTPQGGNPLEPVPLPEQTEPYFPPEHQITIEPKEPKPPQPDSEMVTALRTAPERPFTPVGPPPLVYKKKDPLEEFFRDLPKIERRLTMRDALTTASDRPYSPWSTSSVEIDESLELAQKKRSEDLNLQKPCKPKVLPESFQQIVNGKPVVREEPPTYPGFIQKSFEHSQIEEIKESKVQEQMMVSQVHVEEQPQVIGMYPLFQGFTCSFDNKMDQTQFTVEISTTPPIVTRTTPTTVTTTTMNVEETKSSEVEASKSKETVKIEKQAEEVVLKKPLPLTATLHKPEALPQYQVNLSESVEADLQLMDKIEAATLKHEQLKTCMKPVITVESRSTNQSEPSFKPVPDERPPSSIKSRPITPSMVNRPPSVLPYYQANLVYQPCCAPVTNLLDPKSPGISRSPSPLPPEFRPASPFRSPSAQSTLRPKSPAQGPPPSPLASRAPLPTPENTRKEQAVRSISTYIPEHQSHRTVSGFGQRQEMVLDTEKRQIQSRELEGGSGHVHMAVRESAHSELVEESASIKSQNIEVKREGNVQIQRKKTVTEEFEHCQKSNVVEIEKNVTTVKNYPFRNVKLPPESDEQNIVGLHVTNPQPLTSPFLRSDKSSQALQQTESKVYQAPVKGGASPKPKQTMEQNPVCPRTNQTCPMKSVTSCQESQVCPRTLAQPQENQTCPMKSKPPNLPPVTSCQEGGQENQICPRTLTQAVPATTPLQDQSCQIKCKPSNQVCPRTVTKVVPPTLPPLDQTPLVPPATPPPSPLQSPSGLVTKHVHHPASMLPLRHVQAPGASSTSGSSMQNGRPDQKKSNIPSTVPDLGTGGGRQAGAVGYAPKRGRGVLNTASIGSARVPLCASCHSQIRGPFITALGKIWCPEHFICATPSCRRPLADLGFVEERGQLYCEYCFEQYLAPPCSKCAGKIKGDCLKAIGKNFHPECFNCTYCGKLFGNSPFFLEDGMPYCEADWNELFTTKCFACGFPVEAGDRWVEALNNNYHSQCFNCTMCKKNLEGQSFFAKGGRPFCKNHAR